MVIVAALCGGLLLSDASPAAASRCSGVHDTAPRRVADTTRLDSLVSLRIAPAVSVSAAPRSVQLIAVSVPAEFGDATDVSWTVLVRDAAAAGGVTVSGARSGRMLHDKARVLLTVSIPSGARAGRVPVADVHFTRAQVTTSLVTLEDGERRAGADTPTRTVVRERVSTATVIVPVDVQVTRVVGVHVASAGAMVHVASGAQGHVPVTITNDGNATDTLRLALTVPDGWRASFGDAGPVIVAAGASVTRDLRLSAPRQYLPGSSVVFVEAIRTDTQQPESEAARAARQLAVPVQVVTPTRATTFGPLLGVTYSAVQLPGEAAVDAWGLTLTGPLSRGVDISASWTQRAIAGAPGLSRVGGGQLFPTVALRHARWRLDLGNAAADFGELGGLVRGGRGVSGTIGDTTRRLTAMVARPFLFDGVTRDAGVMAGMQLATMHRGLRITGGVSHLRDPLLTRGALDAITVGVASTIRGTTDARADLAWRQWEHGSALGAAAEVGRRTTAGEWRLRASSAPGGSAAMARAQHDVTLTGGHQLGATRLGVVGWYADDATFTGATHETRGVGLMPQWRLGRTGSLGFDLRLTGTQSGDASARQGSALQVIGGFGSTRVGRMTATSSASLTRLTRTVTLEQRALAPTSEQQLSWTTQLMLPTSLGALDLYSSVQHIAGAASFASGQHDLMLRVEQLAVPLLSDKVQLSGAIGRTTSLATREHVVTQRVGLSALLPFDTHVRLDLERNPWLRANGPRGWTSALRIERSFGAPTMLRGGRGSGVVFEDRNGNGVRDPGERGIPNVVVRVGGEVTITDRSGTYRLTRPGGGVPMVDEQSLPFGLLVTPNGLRGVSSGMRDGRVDIPVSPTGTIDVQLDVEANAIVGELAKDVLQAVSVHAVDMRGGRHLARAVVNGVARFDALPSGTYRLEIDASAASEPLVVQGGMPTFTVTGDVGRQVVRVVLGARRVRMFRGAPVVRSVKESQR